MTTAFIEAGVTELSFVDSAAGGASPVVIPNTARAGDLAVIFNWASGSPGGGTPSGWTTAQSVSGDGGAGRIYYKILTAGDVGDSVSGLTGSIRQQYLAVFRPDDEIEAVSDGSGGAYSGLGNPPAQNVAAGSQETPVLVVGGMAATGTIDISASPSFDALISGRFGYKIYNESASNVTVDATGDGGSKVLLSCYIRVE